MRNNAIARIIIWSIVLVLLVGTLAAVLVGPNWSREFRNRSGSTAETFVPVVSQQSGAIELEPDQIQNIEIEWVSGDIDIRAGNTDKIRFYEENTSDSKYPMVYKISGKTLKIQFSQEEIHFGFGTTINGDIHKDLTIEVPADWICDNLELDVASANLTVSDLVIREVDFDGASGTCDFHSCQVGNLDMDTASGDVTFSGSLNTLDFDAASASFTAVLYGVPRSIDMDSMSGDLDITLPADAGFTLSMDAMSSDFRSEFEYSQNRNGYYVSGDGACRIDVDAMSGDVYIRKAQENATWNVPGETTAP